MAVANQSRPVPACSAGLAAVLSWGRSSPRTIKTRSPGLSWRATCCHRASESNCPASSAGRSMQAAATPSRNRAWREPGPVTQALGRLLGSENPLGPPGGRAAKKPLAALALTNITAAYVGKRSQARRRAAASATGSIAIRGSDKASTPLARRSFTQRCASGNGRVTTTRMALSRCLAAQQPGQSPRPGPAPAPEAARQPARPVHLP